MGPLDGVPIYLPVVPPREDAADPAETDASPAVATLQEPSAPPLPGNILSRIARLLRKVYDYF